MLPSEESSDAESVDGLLYYESSFWTGDAMHFYTAITSPPTDYAHASLPVMINFVHRLTTDRTIASNIEAQQSVFFRLVIQNQDTDHVITATSDSSTAVEVFADLNHKLPSSLSWTHSYRASTTSRTVKELVIPKEDLKGKSYVYIGVRGLATSSFSIRAFTQQMSPIASNQRNVGFIAPKDRQRFFFAAPSTRSSAGAKLIVSLESEAPLKCFVSEFWSDPTEQSHDHLIPPGQTLLADVEDYGYDNQLTWYFSLVHTATVHGTPDPFELYVALVSPLISGMYLWGDLTPSMPEQIYLFTSDGSDSDHWLRIQVYSPSFAPNTSLVSVYVSSVGLPSASRYDYSVDMTSGSTEPVYIEMLHDDQPGEKGAVSGSFLVSVNGYSRSSFYILSLMSSIHVPDRVPFTSSVMLNEKKYFNYRITDPVYERMVSLNATLKPFSKEFESCVSGLSLFASNQYHHPTGVQR
ncbi:hypothetical protein GEMRC1_002889 [Eukaryota sp. GEM-RC1]